MKSRKKLRNREKYFGIEKNISESRKKIRNREKKFGIEKNISELKKIFQNREIFCCKYREKNFGIECFHNVFT